MGTQQGSWHAPTLSIQCLGHLVNWIHAVNYTQTLACKLLPHRNLDCLMEKVVKLFFRLKPSSDRNFHRYSPMLLFNIYLTIIESY